MFTGLIEEVGTVQDIAPASSGMRIVVAARTVLQGSAIGDSLAVNGCCLTITHLGTGQFSTHAGTETLARTTVGEWRPGRPVNLERALRVGSRLGGHFVQGHVDGVGQVLAIRPEGETVRWRFSLPGGLRGLVVEKGSIAVDGVSLTVTAVDEEAFEVALIPHTMAHTTFAQTGLGSRVNLEADVLAKYVQQAVASLTELRRGITETFLREHGFG